MPNASDGRSVEALVYAAKGFQGRVEMDMAADISQS